MTIRSEDSPMTIRSEDSPVKTVSNKKIDDLVQDIYALFGSGHKPDPEGVEELGKAITGHIAQAFAVRENKKELRGSVMGERCARKLWYQANSTQDPEEIAPHTAFKFLYGHIIDELMPFLAKEAGHDVKKRQHEVVVEGVKGHVDAIIDGVLVDVKSANSRGMDKFRNHALESDDPFGYLGQLDFYLGALQDDPDLKEKDKFAFLAVDKELGHLVLDTYSQKSYPGAFGEFIKGVVRKLKDVVSSATLPPRAYEDTAVGASGNRGLCLECRYCIRKQECWPGLRKFIYANGPVWLTRVINTPAVIEVPCNEKEKAPAKGVSGTEVRKDPSFEF